MKNSGDLILGALIGLLGCCVYNNIKREKEEREAYCKRECCKRHCCHYKLYDKNDCDKRR